MSTQDEIEKAAREYREHSGILFAASAFKDGASWATSKQHAEIEELKRNLEITKKALEFYANPRFFENGVISAQDLEPTVKIEGKVIYHYTDPPGEVQVWVGGKMAREALKQLNIQQGENK